MHQYVSEPVARPAPDRIIIDKLHRVSSSGSRDMEKAHTLPIQDERSAALIDSIPGAVAGRTFEYVDFSAFDADDTGIFDDMLARFRSGAAQGVSVPFSARIFRNSYIYGPFLREVERLGCRVYFADIPWLDHRTKEGRHMIATIVAANEQVVLAGKEGAELTVARLTSFCIPTRVPYGFQRNVDAGMPFPDRHEKTLALNGVLPAKGKSKLDSPVAVVRAIFDWKLNGWRISAIVAELNERGIPSPAGERWVRATVDGILQNEAYAGVFVYGRRSSKRGRGGKFNQPGKRGKEERIENAWPAIVSSEELKRASSRRGVTRSGRYKAGIAGGLMICSSCGGPMSVRGSNEQVQAYACRRESGKQKCARPLSVSKKVADAYVLDYLVDFIEDGSTAFVRNAREVEDAKAAWEARVAETESVEAKAHLMDTARFEAQLLPAQEREAEARAHFDAVAAAHVDLHDLPKDRADLLSKPLDVQRRMAASVLARVVVAPAVSRNRYADVAARFTPESAV